jgi:hypothetical protein
MSLPTHTYGPTCHLAKSVAFAGAKSDDDMPDLKPQFFYSSQLPIDDPLAAAPIPSGSDSKSVKHPPRPFSESDNNALEEAWLGLASEKDRKIHNKGKQRKASRPSQKDRTESTIGTLFTPKHKKTFAEEGAKPGPSTKASVTQAPNNSTFKPTKRSKTSNVSADAPHDDSPPHMPNKSDKSTAVDKVRDEAKAVRWNAAKMAGKAGDSAKSGAKTVQDQATKMEGKVNDEAKAVKDEATKLADKAKAGAKPGVKAVQDEAAKLKDKAGSEAKTVKEQAAKDAKKVGDEAKFIKDAAAKTAAKFGDEAKSAKDEASKKLGMDQHGNPYNPNCDDPQHVPLDVDDPDCCSSYEKKDNAKPQSPRGRSEVSHDGTSGNAEPGETGKSKKDKLLKDKKEKHSDSRSASRKSGPGQMDAADDSALDKVACFLKECDPSKQSPKPDECDLDSKEDAGLMKHENSKAHQEFVQHSHVKHSQDQASKSPHKDKKSDGHHSESGDSKWKLFERKTSPSPHGKKADSHSSDDKKAKSLDKSHTSSHDKKSETHPSDSTNKISKLFERKTPSHTKDGSSHNKASEHEDKNSKHSERKSSPSPDKNLGAHSPEPSQRHSKRSDKATMPSPSLHPSVPANHPDPVHDAGTTGRPFLKLPSRPVTPQSPASLAADAQVGACEGDQCADDSRSRRADRDSTETEDLPDHKCKAYKNTKEHAEVPVGVSRLHQVTLPALQMKPIYWTGSDIAAVTRGTWFYKDTMYPVEPPVANQLETGYRELRPWSQTWKDELHSAREVGPAGEEKIAHHLWSKEEHKRSASDDILSTDPYCAARCFKGEAAAEGTDELDDAEKKPFDPNSIVKKYPNAQVIYKDARNAYILKPSLHPSAYYKRSPLSKIQKGVPVGMHVVRGFDTKAWDKLHPSTKKSTFAYKVDDCAAVSGDSDLGKRNVCVACKAQEDRQKVTDLVLVIHGIGQKLSERMEGFNFTHAINGFRRSINAELTNGAVRKVLRDDLGGVMVLPINWRSNLSFDESDTVKVGEHERSGSDFSLKDITPTTIPAVRSLISDVMLDIPYYMSNNKAKMIQAVINEANRVYRLWCKNNPEFHHRGNVHIIAHSLGSAMALDILSKQPTHIPKIDLHGKKINTKHFDFDTKNLFLAGSPASFFLYLEKAHLVPRKERNKPGAEAGDDNDKSIIGDAGTFGCLAVDNIYNIMHQNDPIAYRLNPCADAPYAASLKTAYVPSATTGFFEAIGIAMKSMTPGVATPTDLAVGQMAKPGPIARLPSQLEMDVHNFTAEERAERKCLLLNDNGQVDYCLSSGGGPLEIQYLNMLGAHSSYWGSPDFIRFIVIEVGRKPGRNHCLPNMKAVKVRQKA